MSDIQAQIVARGEEGHPPEPTIINSADQNEALRGLLLLDHLPAIYLLPTHVNEEELHELEELLVAIEAPLVHDIKQARLILTTITTARRARFELHVRGLVTKPLEPEKQSNRPGFDSRNDSHVDKRRKFESNEPGKSGRPLDAVDYERTAVNARLPTISISQAVPWIERDVTDTTTVRVVRSDWLRDSIQSRQLLEMLHYLVYEGEAQSCRNSGSAIRVDVGKAKLPRVPTNAETCSGRPWSGQNQKEGRRDRNAAAAVKDLAGRSFMPSPLPSTGVKRRLLHETTTEHDEVIDLPDQPDWVRNKKVYACERIAPLHPPNEEFIELLKKIRLARILIGDEIGVRAYSTSIASIISYPYLLSSAKEVSLLPGCEQKVATLLHEYLDTGHVQAADEVEKDPVLSILNDFYNIWGVGAATARDFYYDRGWRDHDDIVEYGWKSLNRHQQIGLKYFEDFDQKMSRSEVEYIASAVTYHAKQIVDDNIQCAIVGGYRRGKKESGDVDLIVSHPSTESTKFLISPLVYALENAGFVTHTLILSETNSARNQDALPLKGAGPESRGNGFDTLDKALVVWQDPNWATREADLAANPRAKNPNAHRRVDIIVSPWKTVGCAVAGWTSGTTFQRDLRRYSRRIKGWKYDSSGVRDINTGKWVDLEQWNDEKTRAETWLEAERRVFEGLELPWREPEERNTG